MSAKTVRMLCHLLSTNLISLLTPLQPRSFVPVNGLVLPNKNFSLKKGHCWVLFPFVVSLLMYMLWF